MKGLKLVRTIFLGVLIVIEFVTFMFFLDIFRFVVNPNESFDVALAILLCVISLAFLGISIVALIRNIKDKICFFSHFFMKLTVGLVLFSLPFLWIEDGYYATFLIAVLGASVGIATAVVLVMGKKNKGPKLNGVAYQFDYDYK